MPNHVRNKISMNGITSLPLFLKEHNQIYFDFNKLIQEPENVNWYNWRIDNWGTKWNSYDNKRIDNDTIKFNTAWSAPIKVIQKLSEMYPDEVIEHWWADEDIGSNSGYASYQNGECNYYYNDNFTNEAYETYIECWGECECLYLDDDNNWQRYDCEECEKCYPTW